MKNIKQLILLAICLGSSILLKAQQTEKLEVQVAKKVETPVPQKVDVNQIPAPQSDQAKADANMKTGKPTQLKQPVSDPNAGHTPEQVKTLNGTAQKPEAATKPGAAQKPAKEKPVIHVAPVEQ